MTTEASQETPPDGWVPSGQMQTWLAEHPGRTRLFPEDLAELTGLRLQYIHQLNYQSDLRRSSRWPWPSDLPAPANHLRRKGPPSPWWTPWQVDTWLTARRDRGPGSGRRRKHPITSPQPVSQP